jgi:hypothetical protein
MHESIYGHVSLFNVLILRCNSKLTSTPMSLLIRMCTYMCLTIYTHIYVYQCMCIYKCICILKYPHIHIYKHTFICIHKHIQHTYLYRQTSIYTYHKNTTAPDTVPQKLPGTIDDVYLNTLQKVVLQNLSSGYIFVKH